LDLFSVPPTQTSIEKGEWIPYKPIASLTDESPVEFTITGHGDDYIDLSHTLILISAKVTKADDSPLVDTDVVAPINNWIHSLFNQVDVFFNQKMVSQPDHLYPYRAYIETLLNYNQTAKESHLTSSLWYADTANKFDNPKENQGFKSRQAFIQKSKHVDMVSCLHCDIFGVEKFLLNGVELRVKFNRSKSSFNLQTAEGSGFKVHLLDATLLVRKMTISPTVLLAHTRALETATAKYPLSRVDMKSITISRDIQSKSIDNIYLGQLPTRVIVGFVSNAALNGDFKKSPFNFQHFDISFLCLYIDGRQIPSKALQPEFGSDECAYITSYQSLFAGTNIHYNDDGNCIARTDYPYGYCLHAFHLTPDLSASGRHWSLNKQETLRMEVKFKSSLKETISCIIYSEFNNIIEIDQYRNVLIDYSG
jgi:hypothetical protein